MWHTRPRHMAAWLAALSGLVLASCGDGSDADQRLSAATYGAVSSSAFDAVRDLLSIGEPLESAQVLVVDADARAPGELASDPLLQAHLRAGKWLLLVDLKKSHHDRDVVPLFRTAGSGDSHVAIARRRTDAFGRPAIDLYDFPKSAAVGPTAAESNEMRRSVRQFLAATPDAPRLGFTPPDGLIYVTFNFATPTLSYQFTSTQDGKDTSNGTQNTSLNKTFVYTLFLNNSNNPTGDFQQLLVHGTVASSPLNPALGTNALMITEQGNSVRKNNIGWFQLALDHTITAANPGSFNFVSDSPENVNGETQVTTGINFSINFASPDGGGGLSFGYSDSDTYDVYQWNVVNTAGGQWSWQNQDPWRYETSKFTWGYGTGGGLEDDAKFRLPNPLAANLLIADTMALYSTPTVLSSVETFSHSTVVTYMNVWSFPFEAIFSDYVFFSTSSSWQIDMGAVIPVPIASLSFQPDPVDAASVNQSIGTVTLTSPASMDTIVYLQSNSVNATVVPSVTIKQGQSSATFQVLVNTNGLASGVSTVATILASNAVAFQSQLTVKNGP